VVAEVGASVKGVAVGDEVIGYTDNRASQAEYVVVEATNLTPKPAGDSVGGGGRTVRRRRDRVRHRARRRSECW
jgi:hypothetical protein